MYLTINVHHQQPWLWYLYRNPGIQDYENITQQVGNSCVHFLPGMPSSTSGDSTRYVVTTEQQDFLSSTHCEHKIIICITKVLLIYIEINTHDPTQFIKVNYFSQSGKATTVLFCSYCYCCSSFCSRNKSFILLVDSCFLLLIVREIKERNNTEYPMRNTRRKIPPRDYH